MLFSQGDSKPDVVQMLNGMDHRGKVVKMSTDEITFVHEGESLEYTFLKEEVFKITFGSGLQEVINAKTSKAVQSGMTPLSSPEIPANSVAILPFRFVSDASPAPNDELARNIQDECFRIFNASPGAYTLQGPMNTNATLRKHGISIDQVRDHQSDELCAILGVHQVVMDVVTRDRKGASTGSTSGGYTTVGKGKKNNTNIWNIASGSSPTSVNYETSIALTIFDNTGKRIFDKEHESFWETSNAYKVTLAYLYKGTPMYSK